MSKYPCYGGDSVLSKGVSAECECCSMAATHSVRIQGDYMRGNDDFYNVCPRHLKMAIKETSRMVAHYRTKGKHLAKGATHA